MRRADARPGWPKHVCRMSSCASAAGPSIRLISRLRRRWSGYGRTIARCRAVSARSRARWPRRRRRRQSPTRRVWTSSARRSSVTVREDRLSVADVHSSKAALDPGRARSPRDSIRFEAQRVRLDARPRLEPQRATRAPHRRPRQAGDDAAVGTDAARRDARDEAERVRRIGRAHRHSQRRARLRHDRAPAQDAHPDGGLQS